ncbi:hypothetical protein BT63DRAFT_421033 [Microthyrium microscopicum]|uniref:Uncharacterized protein n=1 Tax=Microthyrium microscopicum TaxID=703497 RepID=A0A6A6UMA5_9PEZI|nr:hypothetical protein BT63DRAFT_421033 [Microthyrium microscopicum]
MWTAVFTEAFPSALYNTIPARTIAPSYNHQIITDETNLPPYHADLFPNYSYSTLASLLTIPDIYTTHLITTAQPTDPATHPLLAVCLRRTTSLDNGTSIVETPREVHARLRGYLIRITHTDSVVRDTALPGTRQRQGMRGRVFGALASGALIKFYEWVGQEYAMREMEAGVALHVVDDYRRIQRLVFWMAHNHQYT